MTQEKTTKPDLTAPEQVNRLAEDMQKHMPWGRGVPTLLALAVKLEAAEAQRDAALGLQQTDHDQLRCAECDCENGGAECTWIKTPDARQEGWRAALWEAAQIAQSYGCCHVPKEIAGEIRALAEKGPNNDRQH